MSRSPHLTRVRTLATALAIGALALSGCTDSGQSPEETSTQSAEPIQANPGEEEPTTPAPSASSVDPHELDPGELDDAQFAAVQSYLTVRENAESTLYPDRAAWEKALRGTTTEAGYTSAVEMYGPADSSNARRVAQAEGYRVQVSVGNCIINPAFENTDTSVAVQCELTDTVTDAEGNLLPSGSVNSTWPYFGEQYAPVMLLAKDGDKWLMDGDYTGQAS